MLIEKIHSPADLKAFSKPELLSLCDELREKITDTVSKNGGHLSSNLGVVELAVALHLCFDSPKDKIIWDVGHQCYAHKILTGRSDRFDTIRQFGGLSGFTVPSESEHDAFIAGHSGNSVSAALGYAHTAAAKGSDAHTVAIVGDGSFTNGMIYEALNNCAAAAKGEKLHLTIILNNNEMSISENVGAVSRYFSRFRSGKRYLSFKRRLTKFTTSIPLIGNGLLHFFRVIKNFFRRMVLSENLFELLGLEYLGPTDGNDLEKLTQILEQAKTMDRPCLVHINTKKGKGYAPAEEKPDVYHSVGAFDKSRGLEKPGSSAYSDLFGEIVCERAQKDKDLCALTAAMCDGTGLTEFKKNFPDRFYDVGIAEEHAMTFAAGLAAAGEHPVLALYSSFTQRCVDQLIHDAALQKLHIVLGIDRSGLVPADGPTHHGVFDTVFLPSVPGVTLYSPETESEMRFSFEKAFDADNFTAVRYPKENKLIPDFEGYTEIDGGDYKFADFGTPEIAVFTYGRVASNVIKAAQCVNNVRVVKLIKIHPLNYAALDNAAKGAKALLFVEEAIENGGVSQKLCANIAHGRKTLIRAVDSFVPHGDKASLFDLLGFTPEKLAKDIEGLKNEN